MPNPHQEATGQLHERRDGQAPAMSVIVVTPDRFSTIRRTVRHLRGQTVQNRLQLIVVGPTSESIDDAEREELAGFQDVEFVAVGQIENVDKAAYHGIQIAAAQVVALIEDHAYPESDWAEALITAHQGHWAAVGSAFRNANPTTNVSWTNLLIAYGHWTEPVERGQTDHVSRHNISFKRQVLEEYGSELEQYLGRDGGLLQDLLTKGHNFYLEPAACVLHANPSLWRSTAELRFEAGRLWAACRATDNRWSLWQRAVYTAGSPLIPPLRFWRMYRELFSGGRRRPLVPRVFPALMVGLAFDALGQMLGYAMGPGHAAEKLAAFEFDRLRHVTVSDRLELAD